VSEAPLIHIGLHKTGTTWLQRGLFADAGAGFCQPWERRAITDRFVVSDPITFDPSATREMFEAEGACPEGLIRVMSHERLSGMPDSGGYDRKRIAEDLARSFPEARVLIVVREQVGMIVSAYAQYVRSGGTLSLRRWMNPPERGRARLPAFDERYFMFDRLTGLYRDLFGSERVLTIPYEQLRADPDAFAARVISFAGAEGSFTPPTSRENPGLSGLACMLKRPANALLVMDRINPRAWVDSERVSVATRGAFERADRLTPGFVRTAFARRMRGAVESWAGDRFRASNRRLNQVVSEDLGALGYRV